MMATRNNSDRMRAVVHDRYVPPEVLRLEEVERPVPKDGEVLIKVHATAVSRRETGLRSTEYFISRLRSTRLWNGPTPSSPMPRRSSRTSTL